MIINSGGLGPRFGNRVGWEAGASQELVYRVYVLDLDNNRGQTFYRDDNDGRDPGVQDRSGSL